MLLVSDALAKPGKTTALAAVQPGTTIEWLLAEDALQTA